MTTQDEVVVYMVLDTEPVSWTYSPKMPRWRAVDFCRDLATIEWDDKRVIRALIVEVPDVKT